MSRIGLGRPNRTLSIFIIKQIKQWLLMQSHFVSILRPLSMQPYIVCITIYHCDNFFAVGKQQTRACVLLLNYFIAKNKFELNPHACVKEGTKQSSLVFSLDPHQHSEGKLTKAVQKITLNLLDGIRAFTAKDQRSFQTRFLFSFLFSITG